MTQLQYDGTMAGLLTTIFDVYERKLECVHIGKEGQLQPDAFAALIIIDSDEQKARRVWIGLRVILPATALDQFYFAFLSEHSGIENVLLAYVRYTFSIKKNIAEDYGNAAVLQVVQTARKVWREKHRMEAFVRFEQLKDGLYYAVIEPDHNVLPLIIKHFKSRYADQDWLIFDVRRKYGIHYDQQTELVTEVQVDWDADDKSLNAGAVMREEPLYQELWKTYFKSTGIKERTNKKLHMQHVPLRYWKYLTEKRL